MMDQELEDMLATMNAGKSWPAGRYVRPSELQPDSSTAIEKSARTPPLAEDYKTATGHLRRCTLKKIREAADAGGRVLVEGALITAEEDDPGLVGIQTSAALYFKDCVFTDGLDLCDAEIRHLAIRECRFAFLAMMRARVAGSVVVEHCVVEKGLNLRGIQVEQTLGLKRTRTYDFEDKRDGRDKYRRALDLRYAQIGSNVFMRYGFHADGLVELSQAHIGGKLDAADATFCARGRKPDPETGEQRKDPRPKALKARGATIGSSVYLNRGFEAHGEVDFRRVSVGNQLSVEAATVDARLPLTGRPMDDPARKRPVALAFSRGTVGGEIKLRQLEKLFGDVLLDRAKTRTFIDDPDDWLRGVRTKALSGYIDLYGFEYESISPPTKRGRARAAWLKAVLPPPETMGEFRRQPWIQLADVMEAMGHQDAGDHVYVEAERRSSSAYFSRIMLPSSLRHRYYAVFPILFWMLTLPLVATLRIVHFVLVDRLLKFGSSSGYIRLAVALFVVFAFNIFVFGMTAASNRMKPLEEEILVYMDQAQSDDLPQWYPPFSTVMYSLDVMLPIDLKQDSRWMPTNSIEPKFENKQLDQVAKFIGKRTQRRRSLLQQAPWLGRFPKWWSLFDAVVGWLALGAFSATFLDQIQRRRRLGK